MIVDIHMHSHRKLATAPGGPPPEERAKRFLLQDYQASKGEVDLSIIIGMKFMPSLGIETSIEDIADQVNAMPDQLAGFCSIYPDDHDAVQQLEHYVRDLKLVGLKLSPIYQQFYPNNPKHFPLYKKAMELGIPVAFHTSHATANRARLIYGDVKLLDDVALEFPDLKIIICHLGFTQYIDTINLIKKHPNVYTDVSYICHLAHLSELSTRVPPPGVHYPYFHWVQPLLYNFSTPGDPDKILFGSDFPAASAKDTLQGLRDLPQMLKQMSLPAIPKASIERIISQNWQRLYKMKNGRLAPLAW